MTARVTQREIREMDVDFDVTNWSTKEVYELLRTDPVYSRVCCSLGVYGVNAAVVRLQSGRLIKSVSRNPNTFIIL